MRKVESDNFAAKSFIRVRRKKKLARYRSKRGCSYIAHSLNPSGITRQGLTNCKRKRIEEKKPKYVYKSPSWRKQNEALSITYEVMASAGIPIFIFTEIYKTYIYSTG